MKLKAIPLLLILATFMLVLVACDSSSSTNYFQTGNDYLNQGDYYKVIQDYDEAIRLDPLDADTYIVRGVAYEALGKTIEAEEDFAKAKELGYPP